MRKRRKGEKSRRLESRGQSFEGEGVRRWREKTQQGGTRGRTRKGRRVRILCMWSLFVTCSLSLLSAHYSLAPRRSISPSIERLGTRLLLAVTALVIGIPLMGTVTVKSGAEVTDTTSVRQSTRGK